MTAMKNNFWAFKDADGKNRAHVPATPMWIAIIRAVQLGLALLILILTAVAANKFRVAWSSLALTWFTFAWTLLHIGWLFISILIVPLIYNIWGQLAVEILSVIFWLASWAALAADAAAIGDYESVYGSRGRTAGITNDFSTGSGCIKASAALGALEWILFVVTLVFFVMALIRFQKGHTTTTTTTTAPAADPEAAAGAAELKTGPDHLHTTQQQAYPDHGAQAQQGFVQQPVSADHVQPQPQQGHQVQPAAYS
ncbi:uncharacterized protein PpBr36_06470 [Pyricularia pennisetigena]|uniref:uncharacterized protein n=1 Tax=Pyricularia pennisetigena TaxID=1578925 RepID=UPI001151C5D3|nr:uncharacterized protein PpBr36_06470 [Pyricularia pennisetigena]TLS23386.1 hypothetical protein PpBr36_06470 [Pyricularia pennisetigena]